MVTNWYADAAPWSPNEDEQRHHQVGTLPGKVLSCHRMIHPLRVQDHPEDGFGGESAS